MTRDELITWLTMMSRGVAITAGVTGCREMDEAIAMLQRDGEAIAALESERDQLLYDRAGLAADCQEWRRHAQDREKVIAALREQLNSPVVLSEWQELVKERDQLRAELAEVKRDADRYRWIRDNHEVSAAAMWIHGNVGPREWDVAIDAAMAGGENGN